MISAEIVEIEEEATTGNIITWVCFKDDGVEKQWYLGAELLIRKGRNVWPLLSGVQNFNGLSEAERDLWVKRNVESHIGVIIKEKIAKLKSSLNTPVITDLKRSTSEINLGQGLSACARGIRLKG